MKKKILSVLIAGQLMLAANFSFSQCGGTFYSNAYTSLTGFTYVGTPTTYINTATPVASALNYNGAVTGPNRIYMSMSTGNLSDISWQAECKINVSAILNEHHYIMAFSNKTTDPNDGTSNSIFATIEGLTWATSPPKIYGYATKGSSFNKSAGIALPSLGTPYYVRLQRLSATSAQLSVFSDAAMTIHVTGSPVCYPIISGTTGLKYLHQGVMNSNTVNMTSTIDDLHVCNNVSYPGPDITVCPNIPCNMSPTLGFGNPVSGYTYSWSPSTFLSNPNIFNPQVCNVTSNITYTLTATSSINEFCSFSSTVNVYALSCLGDQSVGFCSLNHGTAQLGKPALPGVTYSWSPASGLSCTNCAQPLTSITGQTYTVTKNLCYNVPGGGQQCCSCIERWSAYVDNSLCTGLKTAPTNYTALSGIEGNLSVYPNPFNSNFIAVYDGEGEVKIEVMDMLGKILVKQQGNAKEEIKLNMNETPPGMYLVKVTAAGGDTVVKKIIKE